LVPISLKDSSYFTVHGNKKPIYICSTGFDIDTKALMPYDSSKTSLFFIRALDWKPNIDGLFWFLSNVWVKIHEKYPELKFHIAGKNCSATDFENFKNFKNVVFHGEIQSASAFIKAHSIMIVPLFAGSGIRIKIIEGLSLAKIIITTSLGASGIKTENNTIFLTAENAVDFIANIENLLTNTELCKNISKNAFNFAVKNFNNKHIIVNYNSFLKGQIE